MADARQDFFDGFQSQTPFNRRRARSTYLASFSMPIHLRPSSAAAMPVVPDPKKGSRIKSPGSLVCRIRYRISSTGFAAGCCFDSDGNTLNRNTEESRDSRSFPVRTTWINSHVFFQHRLTSPPPPPLRPCPKREAMPTFPATAIGAMRKQPTAIPVRQPNQ